MIWISLVVFLLLAAGVILLFGLTPEDITNDVMRMLSPKKTLREKVLLAQGRKKSRRLTQEILHIRDALNATGKANSFSWVCATSVIMMVAGCIVSVMIGNLFLIPVAAVVFAAIPFAAAAKSIADYDKQVREELETALSIITTSYIRTDDIVNAVRENLAYLKPPITDVFTAFVSDALYVSSDTKRALRNMKEKIDNEIFREWCEALIGCQDDRVLKDTLLPIVGKLTDVRIVNNELATMLGEVRNEYWTMVMMVIGNIPLMYMLNRDWFHSLIFTIPGKVTLALVGAVVVVTSVLMMRYTKPVEYKR
ncbi:MAG: hypothetical protein II914_06505 [Clostridia bacterium]|nr:hypothetical protein [Clostridia bacterium]